MKPERIVTVNLNPSLDITMWVDGLFDDVNHVIKEQTDAGGKGINVSKAISIMGGRTSAFILAGFQNCSIFRKLLQPVKMDLCIVETDGKIRENLTVISPDGITKLNKPGDLISIYDYEKLVDIITSNTQVNDYVAISGSLPRNVEYEDLKVLVENLQSRNIPFSLDTKSLSGDETIRLKPDLIKPNLHEFSAMTGEQYKNFDEIIRAVENFVPSKVNSMLLTMGGDGLIYADKNIVLRGDAIAVDVKSTVGAGDCALAGFLFGKMSGCDIKDCVKYAVAFSCAAVIAEGTAAPSPEKIGELFEIASVFEI